MITRHRTDLESERLECVWVKINDAKSPFLLVGYICRNPASPATWFDDFVRVIDKVPDHKSYILLLKILILNYVNLNQHGTCLFSVFINWFKVRQERRVPQQH